MKIPISKIDLNFFDPRQVDYNEALAKSIKEHGLKNPILVTRINGTDRYAVLSGRMRCRVLEHIGEMEIEAVVVETSISDEDATEMTDILRFIHKYKHRHGMYTVAHLMKAAQYGLLIRVGTGTDAHYQLSEAAKMALAMVEAAENR